MADWQDWIGRSETAQDWVDPALIARWCATLDCTVPDDATAPQGLHWCLTLPDTPTAQLAADGHPRRDSGNRTMLPPIPLPRRMWAASAITFHAPLPAGAAIVRQSRIAAIIPRTGSSGSMVFVDVQHEIRAGATLLVSETQTLVYREAQGAAPVKTAGGQFNTAPWTLTRTVTPAAPLLFRYSALTFNSHRIHYDLPYANGVEGYRGLVVHGPLTASLLLDLARRHCGDNRLTAFRFRATAPAFAGEVLHLALRDAAEGLVMAAFGNDGRQVMDAAGTL
jgi:3-methylfumaryl-CoA hydratase